MHDHSNQTKKLIETVCDQFQQDWSVAFRPDFVPYLKKVGAEHRNALARKLIEIDVERRFETHQEISVVDYVHLGVDCTNIVKEKLSSLGCGVDQTGSFVADDRDDETKSLRLSGESTWSKSKLVVGRSTEPGLESFNDYDIIDEIARGGMGVVYKARHKKLNRIVALKTIRAGEFAGEEEVIRFQSEAAAAAKLDHPGIVPIFEIGESAGRHFFSMAFIDGQSLKGKLAEGPLDSKDAAKLLVKISEAIAFAHDNGIIHRDLKPANVMLDGVGNPKVTDFGLAKVFGSDQGMTGTGQVLGTPGYMPPEQALGAPVDHRADIYSLGAVLYHLTTGRAPFQAANVIDTLRQVIDKEPANPKELNGSIPDDLETITLKCLAKEARHRYQSAKDLIAELERFLADKPILARPSSWLERSLRWCRRNPMAAMVIVLATSLILTLGIGGPLVAIDQANSAAHEKMLKVAAELASKKAIAETEKTQQALLKKEKALLETRNTIHKYVSLIQSEEFFADERFQPIMKRLLSDALEHYERYIQENEHDVSARDELALALQNVGYISNQCGDVRKSVDAYHRAVELYSTGDLEAKNSDQLIRLAGCHMNLGTHHVKSGQFELATREYQNAIELFERVGDRGDQLAAVADNLAKCFHNSGTIHKLNQRFDLALEFYERSMELKDKLVREHPDNIDYQIDVAEGLMNIGIVYRDAGDTDNSEEAFSEAIVSCESLLDEVPSDTELLNILARSQNGLGLLLRLTGRLDKSLQVYKRGEGNFRKLVSLSPNELEHQFELANLLSSMCATYAMKNQMAAAKAVVAEAISLLDKLVKNDPDRDDCADALARSLTNQGRLFMLTKDYDSAERSLNKGVAIAKEIVKRNPIARSTCKNAYFNRASLMDKLQRFEEAIADWDRAIEFEQDSFKPGLRMLRSNSIRRAKAASAENAGTHQG